MPPTKMKRMCVYISKVQGSCFWRALLCEPPPPGPPSPTPSLVHARDPHQEAREVSLAHSLPGNTLTLKRLSPPPERLALLPAPPPQALPHQEPRPWDPESQYIQGALKSDVPLQPLVLFSSSTSPPRQPTHFMSSKLHCRCRKGGQSSSG